MLAVESESFPARSVSTGREPDAFAVAAVWRFPLSPFSLRKDALSGSERRMLPSGSCEWFPVVGPCWRGGLEDFASS